MDVLVNHLGYEPGARAGVVLRGTPTDEPERVALERARTAEVVETASPQRAGHVEDWRDWEFWTAELTTPERTGEYVVSASCDGETVRSRRFRVAPDLLGEEVLPDLLSYFRVERCSGVYDRADREASFAGDRQDTVDVRGGWYDASGDVSKYLSHLHYANYMNPQQIPLVVWGLLDAVEQFDHGDALGGALAADAVEEACFGADYLVRAQDDAGYFYATVYDGWTGDPDDREICAFEGFEAERNDRYEAGFRQGGGAAVAALARTSRLDARGEFSTDAYLDAAVSGFEHLREHNEAYLDDGTENAIDDYCALLAATELAGATAEDRFREAATERAGSLLDRQTDDGWFAADDAAERPFFHASDEGLPIVALCRYLDVVGDAGSDAFADEIRDAIRRYWTFELDLTDDVVNPFGYARQYATATDEDEPRARFFMPHENETGYWWQGENARLGSLAAAALTAAEALDDPSLAADLTAFADDQLDWILGRNPFDVSMLEGVGRNPEPFVANAPQTPGGIVNGITAGVEDEHDVAFYPEEFRNEPGMSWRWTEQWLPHAAWFLFAGARRIGE